MRTCVTTALGTVQIMVGLFNIGLGPGRTSMHGVVSGVGAAYWLGAVFIAAGAVTLCARSFPSSCWVCVAVLANVVGAVFAVVGVVLYSIELAHASLLWMCDLGDLVRVGGHGDGCQKVALFAQRLLTSMDITLIVLCVLQLCVCVFSILGVTALTAKMKDGGDELEEELTDEDEEDEASQLNF